MQRGVRRPRAHPGRAAVISTFLLLATYAIVGVAAVAFAGVGTDGIGLGNPDNADDVFAAIGPALFGDSVLGHIGLLLLSASILTSASASTQTTILPTARTTLSMGVYKAHARVVRQDPHEVSDADDVDHRDGWRFRSCSICCSP